MIIRYLKIDKVSYKTRRAFVNGEWLDIDRDANLVDFRFGETYPVEVSQRLDGSWIIHRIVKETK